VHEVDIFIPAAGTEAIGNQTQILEVRAEQPEYFVHVPEFEVVPGFK
jgi:hypothetical protein